MPIGPDFCPGIVSLSSSGRFPKPTDVRILQVPSYWPSFLSDLPRDCFGAHVRREEKKINLL